MKTLNVRWTQTELTVEKEIKSSVGFKEIIKVMANIETMHILKVGHSEVICCCYFIDIWEVYRFYRGFRKLTPNEKLFKYSSCS